MCEDHRYIERGQTVTMGELTRGEGLFLAEESVAADIQENILNLIASVGEGEGSIQDKQRKLAVHIGLTPDVSVAEIRHRLANLLSFESFSKRPSWL